METWQSISASELEDLVALQLRNCTPAQQATFATYRVSFYRVPFQRATSLEQVFVVAEFPSGLLYYEDVEEGFEVGILDAQGVMTANGCNQLALPHALSRADL